MNCQQFRKMIDSYVGDELLVETNHEVLHHLENCPACRQELAAHRDLRTRLRLAVINAPESQINPAFVQRLEADLQQAALRPTVWTQIKTGAFLNSPVLATAAAACLLFVILFGANRLRRDSSAPEDVAIAGQNRTGKSLENTVPEDSRPAADSDTAQIVKAAWRQVTQEAVGNHENCAVHFRLKEEPIALDKAAEKYGKFNKDLDKTVKSALQNAAFLENEFDKTTEKIEFLKAHSCIFNGRRFAHIVLRDGKRTISILVAETKLPGEDDGGAVVNSQAEGNVQTASFQANRHAVIVASGLSERENMIIAQALLPALRRHIEQAEA